MIEAAIKKWLEEFGFESYEPGTSCYRLVGNSPGTMHYDRVYFMDFGVKAYRFDNLRFIPYGDPELLTKLIEFFGEFGKNEVLCDDYEDQGTNK